jgi:hypothetical protein
MFEKNPTLAQYREQGNEDLVKDRFEILKTFAPDVAKNPITAGSVVAGLLEMGGPTNAIHPNSIDQLVGIQSKIRQGVNNIPWLLTGTAGMGSAMNKLITANDFDPSAAAGT